MKAPKLKKCKVCGDEFKLFNSLQKCCSNACAVALVKTENAKKEKRKHQQAKKEFRLSDKSLQKKLTQALVNKFIRLRDASEPCVSCGKNTGQMHAGHYLSVGSHPHMRYNTRNIFKQCSTCNNHLSGNLIEFRKNLVKRYGVDYVESLEADQTPRKFKNDEVILIGKYYKGMIKVLDTLTD